MTKLRTLMPTYGVAFAFLLLAFVGGAAIDHGSKQEAKTLYTTQLQGCDRGMKDRITTIKVDEATLGAFHETDKRAGYANLTPRRRAAEAELRAAIVDLKSRTTLYTPSYRCDKVIARP